MSEKRFFGENHVFTRWPHYADKRSFTFTLACITNELNWDSLAGEFFFLVEVLVFSMCHGEKRGTEKNIR